LFGPKRILAQFAVHFSPSEHNQEGSERTTRQKRISDEKTQQPIPTKHAIFRFFFQVADKKHLTCEITKVDPLNKALTPKRLFDQFAKQKTYVCSNNAHPSWFRSRVVRPIHSPPRPFYQ
jgi:hypothetical protein